MADEELVMTNKGINTNNKGDSLSRPYVINFTIYYLLPVPPPHLPPLNKSLPTGMENVIFILILPHIIEIQNVLGYY